MNVLVVGGAGYIGGAVTDLLLSTNHEVRVYDMLLYEEAYRKPVGFVCGDLRDRERLQEQLRWADAVVWLAALVGDGACALNPELSVEINQECVAWLADSFDGRILFPSTCSVYGAQGGELDEGATLNPLSVYAATKLAAERALAKNNALIFRLGTLFGVGDLFSRIRLDLVVNVLTVRAAIENKLTVFGGEQFRPLLHVRDAARAIVENLDSDGRGVFNLHSQNLTVLELAERVKAHFPNAQVRRSDVKFQDARNYRVSSDRARSQLGWRPRCTIDEGILEIKELVGAGRIKDLTNPRYTNEAFLSQPTSETALLLRSALTIKPDTAAEILG